MAGRARDLPTLLASFLTALLLGKDRTGADVILQHTRKNTAIRWKHWKFIDGDPRLYNLTKDPGETKNVVAESPGIAEKLQRMLDRFRKEPLSDRAR